LLALLGAHHILHISGIRVKPMLIRHAEKTYDCNAENKVSETKHPKEEATKGKADTNSTQQCSLDHTHGPF
jgi:hypothetical protein